MPGIKPKSVIARQQAVIDQLQRRIETLEGEAKPGGPKGMPGIKPKSGRQQTPREKGPREKGPRKKGPRKPRPHGFARLRMTPTHRVEHALESCPECGTGLAGGWGQRTREIIDLPLVPVQVTEHVFIARICPVCEKRRVPKSDLGGAALGKQRLGVNLLSLIAALREKGRLPWRSIQWYLKTVHQLELSLGAIVGAVHQVAQKAQPAVTEIRDRIRASPVVHADETGWREDGVNGYVWTFSTPTERYFLRRGRNKEVVDEALGDSFDGVLVSDFYAAYHHYPGLKQRCWVHLLRDIHDLKILYPQDQELARWAAAVHRIYLAAETFDHPQALDRRRVQQGLERKLLDLCRPYLKNPAAVQGKLCRRMEKHIKELFVFVAEPVVCPRTTTLRNGACGLWWSAAKSAAAPARNRAPTARWPWPPSSAPGPPGDWTLYRPAASCSFPLNSELLPEQSPIFTLFEAPAALEREDTAAAGPRWQRFRSGQRPAAGAMGRRAARGYNGLRKPID